MEMKHYAVKLIYRITYMKNSIVSDLISWEERVIFVNATSFDEAYSVAEKFALEYEGEYENTSGETVNIKLAFTPNAYLTDLSNIEPGEELYSSGFFDATDEEMKAFMDIICNVDREY